MFLPKIILISDTPSHFSCICKLTDRIFSITEISQDIKNCVETRYSHVKIKGEVSTYKQHTSGHHYFCLKDEGAVLDAICWRGTKLAVALQEGIEIIAYGRITTYPLRSKYQVIVESAVPAGEGALQQLLKDRYKKFKDLGYFDAARKKPLPFLPKKIGVITSETGAVIKDILHRIKDRFPTHVVLWPVLVQGPGAAEQVAKAIEGFHEIEKPDLIIVARGGGSLEDLWAFNEEAVIEAIYQSKIPVIAAIGHETDYTLADYVADKRAPTPTAAAEMAVPVRSDLRATVNQIYWRAERSLNDFLKHQKNIITRTALSDPHRIIDQKILLLDDKFERLIMMTKNRFRNYKNTIERFYFMKPPIDIFYQKARYLYMKLSIKDILQKAMYRLDSCKKTLELTSVDHVLNRGFCIPFNKKGHLVSKATIFDDSYLKLKFHDGEAELTIDELSS